VADNAKVIRDLYDALDRRDGEAMAQLYAPDGRFRDPAFGTLTGEEAGDMWRMLTSRSDDLRVELAEHTAEATRAPPAGSPATPSAAPGGRW
jgi:ketosteroid isomerase-like protein